MDRGEGKGEREGRTEDGKKNMRGWGTCGKEEGILKGI